MPPPASASQHWEQCPTDSLYRFKLKPIRIKFLRGTRVCACLKADSAASVETRVAIPLHSKVVGKLFRYQSRPLDGELITVRVEPAGAQSIDIDSGNDVTSMELEPRDGGLVTKKKLLLWHGDSSDLEGAAWDDITLINVSTSGDLPYQMSVTARCCGTEAKLGVLDILINDPEGSGWRTARYALFRTRTPSLKVTTPSLALGGIKVQLDDGDESTDDELDITRLVKLAGDVTAVDEVPGWTELGGVCTGLTNSDKGRWRQYQECVDEQSGQGDCAVFLYGENRLRLLRGDTVLFCAHSFHYLRDGETVPSGRYDPHEIEIKGETITAVKNSLSLDFTAATNDEGVSRTLHALRLPPRSFAGTFNIVEAVSHTELDGSGLLALCDQISHYQESALESVSVTRLVDLDVNQTGFLEKLPEALHGDFVAANHTFTNRDHQWHHFVIHTFPAHRLIESQLFPDRRPPQVALSGVNFDTNKTFIKPEGADDLRRIGELNTQEPDRKIAIFGHTDRVGSDADNNQLSLVRARSMDALLRHKVGFWFDRFHPGNEVLGSGLPELQWALKETGDFAGPIDGTDTRRYRRP
jgi:hypothetical protein